MQTVPLFGVPVGPELVILIGVVVLLFGSSKIPKLARSLGRAKTEFEDATTAGETELETELAEQEPNPEDERRYNLAGDTDE